MTKHITSLVYLYILPSLVITICAFSTSTSYTTTPTTTTTTSSPNMLLTRRTPDEVQSEIKDPVDPTAFSQAKAILTELRPETQTSCSPSALLSIATRLGDIVTTSDQTTYIVKPKQCEDAFNNLTNEERTSLLNIHARVKFFAEAQRKSVCDMEVDIPGGKAGQSVSPCRGKLFDSVCNF